MTKSRHLHLSPVEHKAKRTLAQVARALDPEAIGPDEALELAHTIADSLSRLPPDQTLILRRKVGVAVGELEALIEELKGELSAVGRDLDKVAAHSGAAAAYTRRASGGQR